MSPEQARGEQVDARSDLFSLGTMLYECIAGVNPFSAPTTFETVRRVQACEYPPVELLRPDVSPELTAILRSAMAKDPRRPPRRRRAPLRVAPGVPLRAEGQPLRRARSRGAAHALPRLGRPRGVGPARAHARDRGREPRRRAHARRDPVVAPGLQRPHRERRPQRRHRAHGRSRRAARGDRARPRARARDAGRRPRSRRQHRRPLGRQALAARGRPHRSHLRPRRARRPRYRNSDTLRPRRPPQPRTRAAARARACNIGRIHVSAAGDPTEDAPLGTLLDTARDLARVREGTTAMSTQAMRQVRSLFEFEPMSRERLGPCRASPASS